MTGEAFLRELWGAKPPGRIALWRLSDKRTILLQSPAGAAGKNGADIYVSVSTLRDGATCDKFSRVTNRDAGAIAGLWLDIDVNGGPDGKTGAAPHLDAARRLASAILEPTLLVRSGYGLHAWWLLEGGPWKFTSEAEQDDAAQLAAQWQKLHRDRATFGLDYTHDLARILRLPGTVNGKGGQSAPVVVEEHRGPRHSLEEIRRLAAAARPVSVAADDGPSAQIRDGRTIDPARLAALLDDQGFSDLYNHADGQTDMSAVDMSIACMLVRRTAGVTDQDIADVIAAHRAHHGDRKGKGRRVDYLQRTIRKAREHVAQDDPTPPADKPAGRTVKASDVTMKRQRWLWAGRLLLGSVSLLVGKEGVGKSTVTAWLAARVTRGELPGKRYGTPAPVLLVAAEDDIGEVWVPRLLLAGADLELVEFLDMDKLGPGWNVAQGIDEIRAAVKRTGAVLVVIDAVLDHLPTPKPGEGTRSPTFVRAALEPLKRMARDLGVCVPLGMHPPKGVRVEYRDMVQESQAFTAVARTGLLVAWHPEDGELSEDDRRRILLRGKGNYGRNPGGVAFRIASGQIDLDDGGPPLEHGYVTDVVETPLTMSDLSPRPERGEAPAAEVKIDRACELVAEILGDGEWHPAGSITEMLDAQGVGGKGRTAEVKRRLRVETDRTATVPPKVLWRLPAASSSQGADPLTLSARARDTQDATDPLEPNPPKTPISTQWVSGSARVNETGNGPTAGGQWVSGSDAHRARELLTGDELVEAFLADPDLGAVEIFEEAAR